MDTAAVPTGNTFAEKLDRLFKEVRPLGREFTQDEVASAISAGGEISITSPYLSQLRNGQRANPSRNVIQALADFFGVSPIYFFDDNLGAQIEAELKLLAAMRNASVREIALRAAELSPESLSNLATLIEHWSQLERGKARAR